MADGRDDVRQILAATSDEQVVSNAEPIEVGHGHGRALLDLYDTALPEVYGYLKPRCGDPALAEDLAAETFLSACDSIQRDTVDEVTVAWLIGIARHKLVDHWRREARRERHLRAVADVAEDTDDPWAGALDAVIIERTLTLLSPINRVALTLRYLDGLPVAEAADMIDRSVPATDQVLARARRAFRTELGDQR